VLVPGKVYDWSLVYDPAAEGGKGGDSGHAGRGVRHAPAQGRTQGGGRTVRPLRVAHLEHRRVTGSRLPGRPQVHGGAAGAMRRPPVNVRTPGQSTC
jgi:hypothetical protein